MCFINACIVIVFSTIHAIKEHLQIFNNCTPDGIIYGWSHLSCQMKIILVVENSTTLQRYQLFFLKGFCIFLYKTGIKNLTHFSVVNIIAAQSPIHFQVDVIYLMIYFPLFKKRNENTFLKMSESSRT